ncbi:SdpI family protein [Streptomyces nitrosporeus]|uniref:SdpI family protein n=1 Tax=Streptomyces nitrosporeus TaxID=28894 RepID=A0A5J6FDV8_9ACTN|nr:SdpI family protein [Streptomyces nitrosporeus]QEU73060.1 SdpI family protein [Streptomyces nitrosporeus]
MDPAAGLVFAVGLLALGAVIHYVKNQVAGGKIQRNSVVGIRTRATMSSDGAWQAGHASAVPVLKATFLTAYATGATSLVLGLALSSGDAGNPVAFIVPAAGYAVVLALLIAASLKADAAARAVDRPDG